MSVEKSKDNRVRNFATMVYPDSAPENWLEILQQYFVPAFVSPLHDKDVNPTGEPKKPHFHVLLMFDGKKSDEQVREILNSIGGVGLEKVGSIRGYSRYLCHLDNPEKARYQEDMVVSLCGADYRSMIGLATDKYVAIGEMQDFCDKYNVFSFYALSQYARSHRPDWHRILCDSGAIFMREWLSSRQWSKENGYDTIIDPETGEKII